MPRIDFTPWRDQADLLDVRQAFYPVEGITEPDSRRKACLKVSMWKMRGSLPHSIESTASLTDAVLHDNPSLNSIPSIQSTYSMAFCRFVTGMVDTEQNTKHKRSMFKIGHELGFPPAFVEIRHRATHEELPSLVVLRQITDEALSWLRLHFWNKIDNPQVTGSLTGIEIEATDGNLPSLRDALREILRTNWRNTSGARRTRNSDKAASKSVQMAIEAGHEIIRLCQASPAKQLELVSVLLEQKMLIPSTETLSSNIDQVFLFWDDLLKRLAFHQRKFLIVLTNEMLLILSRLSALDNDNGAPMDITKEAYKEAVAMWLEHIFTAEEWKVARERGKLNMESIIRACLANQNFWTLRLGLAIIKCKAHAEIANAYGTAIFTGIKEHKISYPGNLLKTFVALDKFGWVPGKGGKEQ